MPLSRVMRALKQGAGDVASGGALAQHVAQSPVLKNRKGLDTVTDGHTALGPAVQHWAAPPAVVEQDW